MLMSIETGPQRQKTPAFTHCIVNVNAMVLISMCAVTYIRVKNGTWKTH